MVDFWGHMVLKHVIWQKKIYHITQKKDFCLPYDITTAEFGPQ